MQPRSGVDARRYAFARRYGWADTYLWWRSLRDVFLPETVVHEGRPLY